MAIVANDGPRVAAIGHAAVASLAIASPARHLCTGAPSEGEDEPGRCVCAAVGRQGERATGSPCRQRGRLFDWHSRDKSAALRFFDAFRTMLAEPLLVIMQPSSGKLLQSGAFHIDGGL